MPSALATSLTTLFLGLSSLFPYQAFSTTDSESLPIIDTSALVGSTSSVLMRFNNTSVLIVNSLLSVLIFIIVNPRLCVLFLQILSPIPI
jgi:hypothetical protein